MKHGVSPSPARGAIKVAFCENGAGYGGAIISLEAMLAHLATRREQPFAPLLYTSLDTEPYRRLARFGHWRHMAPRPLVERAALARRGVPFASHIDNLANVLPYALRYYRAFRADGARLVYLNNDATTNFAAAIGARLARLPTVLHARGFHSVTRVDRMVLSWVDHCMPVSNAVRESLLKVGIAPEKCTVVAEGLDLAQFAPRAPLPALRAELGLNPDDPVITLVGGLIDWKGQDVLLAAAPLITARYPRARFLLVGDAYGRDNLFAQALAQKAASAELAGRVMLLGGRRDIPDLLAISSVVVHASTLPEPFGRTFLEGMAAGRPVIAAAEGGPLDVIEHEHDGLLVAPRDPQLLANAILRLLDNPESAASMARAGAATAQHYSIRNHTDAVSAILQRLIREPQQAPH